MFFLYSSRATMKTNDNRRYSSTRFQIDNRRARHLDRIRVSGQSTRMCSNWPMWPGLSARLFRTKRTKNHFRQATTVSHQIKETHIDTRAVRPHRCFGYIIEVSTAPDDSFHFCFDCEQVVSYSTNKMWCALPFFRRL